MNTRAIDMADAVVRRYKTRDPEEIHSKKISAVRTDITPEERSLP